MATLSCGIARLDDLEAILGLERAGFPASEQWSPASWESELAGGPLQVLAARDDHLPADDHQPADDQLCGVIALRFGPDVCDLDRIVVDPRRRRQGIGSSLLAAGLELAATRGVQEMILEVRCDNAAAIELYRAYGFEQLAVRDNYYGPGQHAMIMRRPVGGDDDE